jgi:hypothetical protein
VSEETVCFPTIKVISASRWERLSEKRLFFGHQSVGNNIIDGIKGMMKENPQIKLNIINGNNIAGNSNTPFFGHTWIGENTNPKSKIDAFTAFLDRGGVGDSLDVAMLKFCYVDITAKTDIQEVFDLYRNAMSRLKNEYPRTRFVHITVPLTSKESFPRSWIIKFKNLVKLIIGRPVFDYQDNINRNRLNGMLRKEYDGKEPFFDLAMIESTYPNGRRASFTKDGKVYYCMVPVYTDDGGHLNEIGRNHLSQQLLIFLANLSN